VDIFNPENWFIGFFIFIMVLAVGGSSISNQLYQRHQKTLEDLRKEQPYHEHFLPSHPLRLLMAELEGAPHSQPNQPAYPLNLKSAASGLFVLIFMLVFLVGAAHLSFTDGLLDELNRISYTVTREIEYFFLVREVPYDIYQALGVAAPIVVFFALILAGPLLIYIILWGLRFVWRALTWRHSVGYLLEVNPHSEIKIVRSSKSSSRSYYYATYTTALYHDEAQEPQIAYSRVEGWRQAYRAAQRYRVGQRVALRLSHDGRYALVGRVLDDANKPKTGGALIERV